MSELFGGIDIGGTKAGVCVGSGSGEVIASTSFETGGSPADLLGRCRDALSVLLDGRSLAGVGVSVPGPFDRVSRCFVDPPNMPGWHGFDLGAWMDGAFACRTRCMNDANAAALAEWLWGAERGVHTLVFLTVSTGLGGGIVIEGRPIEGAHGFAAEVGRIRLADDGPAAFGAKGTAEAFASGHGIALLAQAEVERCRALGEATALASADPLDARAVCSAATGGDAAALRVVETAAERLGQLIAIVATVVEPTVVVLGTIAAAHPELFVPTAVRSARRDMLRATANGLRVVPSTLEHRWERQALAAIVGNR